MLDGNKAVRGGNKAVRGKVRNPMANLRVELCGELVGHLVGTERRTFDFVTDKNAIENHSHHLRRMPANGRPPSSKRASDRPSTTQNHQTSERGEAPMSDDDTPIDDLIDGLAIDKDYGSPNDDRDGDFEVLGAEVVNWRELTDDQAPEVWAQLREWVEWHAWTRLSQVKDIVSP